MKVGGMIMLWFVPVFGAVIVLLGNLFLAGFFFSSGGAALDTEVNKASSRGLQNAPKFAANFSRLWKKNSK